MTSCVCLNTADSHQKQTTFSSVTTLTEVNSLSRLSVFSSRTRSNTPKISSSCEATTSVRVLTGYTGFTMNVRFFFFPRHSLPGCMSHLRFGNIDALWNSGKRRYNIKLWKTFTDCFNCLPIAAIIDEKIFTMHGGLSPDLQSMEQIRRVMRPTDVPDTGGFFKDQNISVGIIIEGCVFLGLLCDLLWSDPDKDITGWSENDRGVSFTFGPDVVSRFLQKHDMDLICRAHQVCDTFLKSDRPRSIRPLRVVRSPLRFSILPNCK